MQTRAPARQGFPKDSVTYIINHVVLPPKLPQAEESQDKIRIRVRDLLSMMVEVSIKYTTSYADLARSEVWEKITKMLETLQAVEADNVLQSDKLVAQLEAMNVQGRCIPHYWARSDCTDGSA